MIKKIGIGLLILFIGIQFFRIDKTAPKVNVQNDFMALTSPPDEIAKIIKTSCYNCHSFETQYPWYSNVAPVSWWLKHHVNEGREELNFSVWSDYTQKKKKHKLKECWEEVEEGEMPLKGYLIAHREAKLSVEDKAMLVSWFKKKSK